MNALIIENDRAAADRLIRMINDHIPELKIVNHFFSVAQSCDFLNNNPKPNIIFINIDLSKDSSYEIFKQLEIQTPIVFTTDHRQNALITFKSNAFDILLKPIKLRSLLDVFYRLKGLNSTLIKSHQLFREPTFMIKFGSNFHLIPFSEIRYVYDKQNVRVIVRKDHEKLPIYLSLDNIESEINSIDFFRISKSILVHIEAIKHLEYKENKPYFMINQNGGELYTVNQRSVKKFNNWIHKHQKL